MFWFALLFNKLVDLQIKPASLILIKFQALYEWHLQVLDAAVDLKNSS